MSTTSHHKHSSTTASPSATSSLSASQASSNSSSTTIIIAAVAASVGGIIVVIILIRFIRHRLKRNDSAPLPPVQPIAHHREQQLAQFEEQKYFNGNGNVYGSRANSRVSTWYGEQHLMAPPQQLSLAPSSGGSISDTSLLHHTVSNNNNNRESDAIYADSSLDHEMSILMCENPLSPPSQSVIGLPTSASNVNGSEFDIGVPSMEGPMSTSPPNLSPSREASPSPSRIPNLSVSSPNSGAFSIPPPHLRHPGTRPSSMHSTTSRASRKSTASNLNIIRGAPHGPHSSIQIVLPTPLAPGYGLGGDGHMSGRSSEDWGERLEGGSETRSRTDSHSRLSIVDKWAAVPSGGSRKGERESSRGREKERKLSKQFDRKASSASAGAGSRTSIAYSTSSHQPNSHSFSHLHYPHPSVYTPSKSPLFRTHSPNVNLTSSSTSSALSNSPPPSSSASINQHIPSSSLPVAPAQLRTSSSVPPSASREYSRTPPPLPPPVPRIPSMYSNYNNNNSNSNFDTSDQFTSGSGAGTAVEGVMEVERGRRLTPAVGFGSKLPVAPPKDVMALVPRVTTATSSMSMCLDDKVQV